MSTLYCYQDLGDHTPQCDVKMGGISAFAVLFRGHDITDFADEAQWQTAIDAGTAKVVKEVKGDYPLPSAVESESLNGCGPENTLDAFDHELTIMDGNVSQANVEFYDDLNNAKAVGIVWYNCSEETVSVGLGQVRFQAPRLEGNNATKQQFTTTARWRTRKIPDIATAPAGIFE